LVRDALGRSGGAADVSDVLGFAARAKAWESRADQIVGRSRTVVEHGAGDGAITSLLSEADDVADGLEEAAFLLTLAPAEHASRTCLDALRELAELMTSGTQSYVKCLESARDDLEEVAECLGDAADSIPISAETGSNSGPEFSPQLSCCLRRLRGDNGLA